MSEQDFALTPDEVRAYIHDYSENNHLIEGEEFSDGSIQLAMKLALSDYNTIPPLSTVSPKMFPSLSLLLYGTLAHLFLGKAANLARNTMAYSDGGLNIPVEERAELYMNLGNQYMTQFKDLANRLKIQQNIESGYGSVSSDYRYFPLW